MSAGWRWLCFVLWLRVPYRWQGTRWAMFLLQRAGSHAYPAPPERPA